MKVYTKTGDAGTTGILGGTRLPKDHARIEAYGNVDELNAHLGLLRDLAGDAADELIVPIQNDLFTLGSHLAADPEKNKMELPELPSERIAQIEQEIDLIDEQLPPLKNFVLPGGHPAVSQCHIARCVCRRAERATIALAHASYVQKEILVYLNRLSDLLFVYARKLTYDLGAKETPWIPKKEK